MARVLHFIKSQLATDEVSQSRPDCRKTKNQQWLKKTPSLGKLENLPRDRKPGELLSLFEFGLVKSSWNSIGPDHAKFMEMVLGKVFEESSSLQYTFLWDRVNMEVLMENKIFKHVAAMIAKVIEDCLQQFPTEEVSVHLSASLVCSLVADATMVIVSPS